MPPVPTHTLYWHADDIGLSHGITQSIATCFDVLNSVSVIVNGTDLTGAVNAIQQHDAQNPDRPMRVVLHLNFMEGHALSGKSIICPNGIFDKDFIAFWRYAIQNRRDKIGFRDTIYAETLHQIRAFEDAFGHPPTLVDCHQHMHMIPIVAEGVARALSEAGIDKMRIPNDYLWVRSPMINMVKYGVLKTLTWKTRRIWHNHNISPPCAFFGVLPTGTAHTDIYAPALQHAHRYAQDLEILFHPGKALITEYENWKNRPNLWAYYHNSQREAEAKILRQLYTQYNINGNNYV